MLDKRDIFQIKVMDEMIFAGVDYAEKTLHYTFNRMGLKNHYKRIQNIVKGIVMEHAFRDVLDHHGVKYDLLGRTHWTQKDRYDVGIDGHRYDVKGNMVEGKSKEIQQDPAWLLDCAALVPADQVNSRNLQEDDYYVFPFMTGYFMKDLEEINGVFSEFDFSYLIHSFWDYEWVKNDEWEVSKGLISIESNMTEPIHLRIGGQGEDKELLVNEFDLEPGQRIDLQGEYFTVLFAQTLDRPSGELLLTQEDFGVEEIIGINNWGNIWLYGGVVYQTGYISKGEFKEKSKHIPRFYKGCKQYAETKVENQTLTVNQLHSLRELLTGPGTLER